MPVILPRSWKEEFALAANQRREDILYRERTAQLVAQQRQITIEKQIQEKRREQEFMAVMEAIVPPARIAEYQVKLDRYDTKTVEALMDNEQAREFVREKINTMLGQAHTLPDGRRVFKTIDGQKVFDEHGQELEREKIDPATIDDKRPKWEMFKDALDERTRLAQEREKLLDYQGKLDQARARLDKGDITEGELRDMDDRLAKDMPDAVRKKLGMDEAKADSAPKAEQRSPELPSNMDAMMRQTGLGPAAPSL